MHVVICQIEPNFKLLEGGVRGGGKGGQVPPELSIFLLIMIMN